MPVFCGQCGYESPVGMRFCGMCGTELPRRVAPQAPSASPPPPPSSSVSGLSFLGLADEPPSSGAYLLEDDLSKSHWGRPLLLVLLIGGAVAAWYWRQPLREEFARLRPRQETHAAQVSYSASPISTSGSELGGMPNAQALQPTSAPEGQPAAAAPPQPQPSQVQPAADKSSAVSSKQTPAAADQPPAQTASERQPSPTEPAAPTKEVDVKKPGPAPDEALEVDGEHYLYGPQTSANCARAEKDFLAAADRDNAKAESVLGTMYATGHCVPQDLALSYRWFAKALQQDPQNGRLEQDVQMVWNQMSADQKQLATRH